MIKSFSTFIIAALFTVIAFHTILPEAAAQRTITVTATAEDEAVADLLLFQVNITHFHTNAQEAFRRHKEQESFLTTVLLEEEIDESNIFANPISINPTRRQHDGSGFETRQQVTIRMDDVTKFEAMQILLIENGFVNFSGSFSSTKIQEASDEALKAAVEEAKRKADLLASASGEKVLAIKSIEYGQRTDTTRRTSGLMMAMEASVDGGLLQFERTIPVRENVNIIFYLDH